jgi:hypothetical protein
MKCAVPDQKSSQERLPWKYMSIVRDVNHGGDGRKHAGLSADVASAVEVQPMTSCEATVGRSRGACQGCRRLQSAAKAPETRGSCTRGGYGVKSLWGRITLPGQWRDTAPDLVLREGWSTGGVQQDSRPPQGPAGQDCRGGRLIILWHSVPDIKCHEVLGSYVQVRMPVKASDQLFVSASGCGGLKACRAERPRRGGRGWSGGGAANRHWLFLALCFFFVGVTDALCPNLCRCVLDYRPKMRE